jgi:hypothetical protein
LSTILDQSAISIELLSEAIVGKYPTISPLGAGLLQPELIRNFEEEYYQLLQVTRYVWM